MESLWTADPGLVKQLYNVFRKNADKVCGGQSTISLSPYAVKILHDSFCRITNSDVRNPSFEVIPSTFIEFSTYRELLFLFDIAQRATDLKLLQNDRTLDGRLSIAAFSKLHRLELNCVPLHYVYGISTLRPTLRHLVCIGCFEKLEDLLMGCGADKTEGLDWSALSQVQLSYNNLQRLHQSLVLIPEVRNLDLSHNSISDADIHLLTLKHLDALNLSFNELIQFPLVGNTVTSLNLRNNRITSLNGIETLTQLRSLDLSYNLLHNHQQLEGLRCLNCLKELLLHNNPFCFKSNHRRLAILNLNADVVHEIILDGEELSYCEKKCYKSERKTPAARVLRTTTDPVVVHAANSSNRTKHVRKNPKKCRVRVINLDEVDGNHTTQTEDHEWTLVSTEFRVQSLPDSVVLTYENDTSAVNECSSPVAEGDDVSYGLSRRHNAMRHKKRSRPRLSLTSASISSIETTGSVDQVEVQFPGNRLLSPIEDTACQLDKCNASNVANGNANVVCEAQLTVELVRDEAICSTFSAAEQQEQSNCVRSVDSCLSNKTDSSIDNNPFRSTAVSNDGLDNNPFSSTAEDDDESVEAEKRKLEEVITLTEVELKKKEVDMNETDVYSLFRAKDVLPINEESTQIRPSTESDLTSYCTVYEPLTRNHRFINTNSSHFVVIQIGGALPVIAEYRLTSLTSVKIVSDSYELGPDEESSDVECTGPVLQLTFTGMKSSLITLTYVMYDKEEAKLIKDKLDPLIKSRQTVLECLKCSQRFLDSQATFEVKVSSDTSSESQPFKRGSLHEVPVCPYCSSDVILEMPSESSVNRPSVVQEPPTSSTMLNSVLSGILSLTRISSNPQLISPLKHSLEAELSASVDRDRSGGTPSVIQDGAVLTNVVDGMEQCGGYSVYNNDFRRFDPRLSLNIDLNLFKAENEQLLLLLKAPVMVNSKQESSQFNSLLIISTSKVYIAQMHDTGSCSDVDFNSWLKVRYTLVMKKAINITVGFRGQTLIVESPTNELNFTFLICNVDWCKRLINDISDVMAEYGLALSPAICAKDRTALNSLIQQLCDEFVFKKDKEPCFHGYAVSQGYHATVHHVTETSHCGLVGVLVTMTHVCLVKETINPVNRRPCVITEPPEGAVHFTVLEKQTTNNIVHLDVSSKSPWQLTVHFESEFERIPISWTLLLHNISSVKELIDSMQDSYFKVFEVPLHVNHN